jgi:phosphopantothenoylcysteine decarboxylase/phosphopantothenate--cysteine ligase
MASILLGVSGSAACFKAAALASALTKANHKVQVVMTAAAVEFVGPLQFSCLTGHAALVDEFDPADPSGMDHISLARAADLMIIVPATANTLGMLAGGLAPNLLGSLALAFEAQKPRLFVPAMNPEMWSNPAVQRNVATLLADGWRQVGPAKGDTACGEVGEGRMLEADEVLAAISAALQS